MRKTRLILLAALSGACLFFLLEKPAVRAVPAGSTMPRNLDLLERVINLIRNDYLEEKDPVQTMDGSFRGLVNALDTGCSYLDAESTARYRAQKSQPIQETGLILTKRYGNFPLVVGLIENSPAAKAGIEIGDSLTEINGLGTATMSLAESNLYLNDIEAKPVDVKMLRDDKTLEFKLDRTSPASEPFAYKPLEGTAGILQVVRVTPATAVQITSQVVPAVRKQKRALILDLRNCRGGDFIGAQHLVNLFLRADSVGYIMGRGQTKDLLPAPAPPALESTRLLIWVNGATVGPAEAVAGVLKDFNRAKVVGQSTPGLVAREEFVPLDDGTSVLLTTGIFCLRSGGKLWGQGVEPDVKVEASGAGRDGYLKKTRDLLATAD